MTNAVAFAPKPSYHWSPPELQRLGLPATSARSAGLLFLSAVIPWDARNARLIASLNDTPKDVPGRFQVWGEHQWGREGPAIAQAWAVYHKVDELLRSEGRSLADIVRQRIYVTRADDVRPVEEVMLSFFGDDLPATTFACVSRPGTGHDLRVWVDVIASAPEGDGPSPSRVYLPELRSVFEPYPAAVRMGQYVFFSGIEGINPETGQAAVDLGELSPDTRSRLAPDPRRSSRGDAAYRAQMAFIHAHIERILVSLGGDMAAMARLTGITSKTMTESGAWQPYHMALHGTRERTPTLTFLTGAQQVSSDAAVLAVCDGVAVLPGSWSLDSFANEGAEMAVLPMIKAAGPLVFNTGYIGMNRDTHAPHARLNELEGLGRQLGAGRLDSNEAALAQAWHIYETLDALLNQAGSALARVVHQTVFMVDLSLRPIIDAVARAFVADLPPTAYVGVQDIGPYPGLLFEVEAFATR